MAHAVTATFCKVGCQYRHNHGKSCLSELASRRIYRYKLGVCLLRILGVRLKETLHGIRCNSLRMGPAMGLPLPDPFPEYLVCPHCGETKVEVFC
jgi:hypothetical protein